MKKKYKVSYTWHSGECFDSYMDDETTIEIEESDLDFWKKTFEEENIDGSYCSINSVKEL